MQRALALP